MRAKNVNRPDLVKGFLRTVDTGARVFGMVKGAYDTYKTISAAVQTAAPYVRTLATVL